MKMIKILLSTIILLAILIFLILPPILGLWIKHQYCNILSELNRSHPNITASISNYRFGWFQSTINLKLDMHFKNGMTKHQIDNINTRLTGYLTIRQGPIIIRKQRGHYNTYLALADMNLKSPELHLRAHSIWHFNLLVVGQFSSTSFQIVSIPLHIYGKNLQGMLTYDLSTHHFKLHTTIDLLKTALFNLKMTPSRPIISINHLNYSANLQKKGFINFGSQDFSAKKVTINLDPASPITISNIRAISNTRLHHGKIDIAATYNLQSITQNKFNVSGLQLDFSIRNVNEKRFNQLLKILSKNKKAQTADYTSFVTSGIVLLREGLSININQLMLRTPYGIVSLVGELDIPKLSDDATLLTIPMMIKANVYFQSPKTWLTQQITSFYAYLHSTQPSYSSINPQQMANDTLNKWLQQQLIIPSDHYFKTQIQFQGGRLRFNGKPMIPQPTSRTNTPQ